MLFGFVPTVALELKHAGYLQTSVISKVPFVRLISLCSMFQTDNTDSLPGFELLYIAVYGGTHAVGGSTIGRKFLLESDSHIPYSFVGYVGAKSGIYSSMYVYACALYVCANVQNRLHNQIMLIETQVV